jgi:hypothetical protein
MIKFIVENWDNQLVGFTVKPTVDQLTKYTRDPTKSIELLKGATVLIGNEYYWLKEKKDV